MNGREGAQRKKKETEQSSFLGGKTEELSSGGELSAWREGAAVRLLGAGLGGQEPGWGP